LGACFDSGKGALGLLSEVRTQFQSLIRVAQQFGKRLQDRFAHKLSEFISCLVGYIGGHNFSVPFAAEFQLCVIIRTRLLRIQGVSGLQPPSARPTRRDTV
jgi:hypothetical protein